MVKDGYGSNLLSRSSIIDPRPLLFDQCKSNPTTFAGFFVHTVYSSS